jgi:GNAT superfamily N-acetyltransferase
METLTTVDSRNWLDAGFLAVDLFVRVTLAGGPDIVHAAPEDRVMRIGRLVLKKEHRLKHCAKNVRALQAFGYYADVFFDVDNVEIAERYRSQGLGKALYRAAFAQAREFIGSPVYVAPNQCTFGTGATSASALRVWRALAREYPHSDMVLFIA